MPKVKVGDINMYYEIHGGGEPLVYIYGRNGTVESARQQIQDFSETFRLVLFDFRGAGQSDAPDVPYTTEMIADELAELLDLIGINKAHIHGASMGGTIAQQFAIRHPNRVISLILQCTSCGGLNRVAADAEVIKFNSEIANMTPDERATAQVSIVVTKEFIDNNPGIIDRMVEQNKKAATPSHGLMRRTEAAMTHDTYDRLPEIQAPTLILHGDADRMVPLQNGRILASRIPDSELVVFPNTGHIFLESRAEVNQTILDFLKKHPLIK